MNRFDRYMTIFMNVFGVGKESLNENFSFADVPNWDSMAHITLISELENAFEVMFDTEDILTFGSFENGRKILEKYGVSFED